MQICNGEVSTSVAGRLLEEGADDPQGRWVTDAHTLDKLQNLSDRSHTLKTKENLGNTNVLSLVLITNR